jgi:hypothetical protein
MEPVHLTKSYLLQFEWVRIVAHAHASIRGNNFEMLCIRQTNPHKRLDQNV